MSQTIEIIAHFIYGFLATYGLSTILENLKTPEKIMKYVKILLFCAIAYAAIAFINAEHNPFVWEQKDRVLLVIYWVFIVAFSRVKWERFFKEDNGSMDNDDIFLGI